jgi:hypothetical protein
MFKVWRELYIDRALFVFGLLALVLMLSGCGGPGAYIDPTKLAETPGWMRTEPCRLTETPEDDGDPVSRNKKYAEDRKCNQKNINKIYGLQEHVREIKKK